MTLSGFTDRQLIAYLGECKVCFKTEKAYYIYADRETQDEMVLGTIKGQWRNCPACASQGKARMSMKFIDQVPRSEVDRDLQILQSGMQINFDAALDQAKDNEKMDKQADNDEKRMDEYMKWISKK